MSELKVFLNEDGITVGELKQFLDGLDDDMKISDTQYHDNTTWSSRITEVLLDEEGVAIISRITRSFIEGHIK